MFEVNDKVVCIEDRFWASPMQYLHTLFPIKDQIYCIRGIVPSHGQSYGILLVGIESGINPSGVEQSWYYQHFRKVNQTKSSVSITEENLIEQKNNI